MSDAPRCLECYYTLYGLENPRCPECGRPFDLADPTTYTTRPPFVRWQLWLPGFVLAVISGLVVTLLLLATGVVGAALTLAVPFSVGSLLGYRCRVGRVALVLLAICAVFAIILSLVTASASGVFCGLVAAVVWGGPAMVGSFFGWLLRRHLKSTAFSQRAWLPAVALMIAPLGWGLLEAHRRVPLPPTSVQTSRLLPIAIDEAWANAKFYEQIDQPPPPLLFRLGAPRPLHTQGTLDAVGSTQVCVYEHGSVTKRLTRRDAPTHLSFNVIEQDIGFDRSVRLRSGSFAFEAVAPERTRVTLTTEYEPLLQPRWCWQPFERLIVHTLHDHIFGGFAAHAEPPPALSIASAEHRP